MCVSSYLYSPSSVSITELYSHTGNDSYMNGRRERGGKERERGSGKETISIRRGRERESKERSNKRDKREVGSRIAQLLMVIHYVIN